MANSDDLLNEITKDRKPKPQGGLEGLKQAKDSGFLPYLAGVGATAGAGAYVYNELDDARNAVLAEIAAERKASSQIANRVFRVGSEKGPLAFPIGGAIRSPSGIPYDANDYNQLLKTIEERRLAERQRAEGEKGRAKQQTQQAEKYGEKIPRKTPAVKVRYGKGDFGQNLILNEISRINEMPATTKADMLARQKAVVDLMNNPMFEDSKYQNFIDEQVKRRGVLPQAAKPRINPQTYVIPPATPKLTAEQEALNEIRKMRTVIGDPVASGVDVNALARHRAFPRLFPAPEGSNRPSSARMVEVVVPSTGERFTTTVGPDTKVIGPDSMPLRKAPPKLPPATLLETGAKLAGKIGRAATSKWVTIPTAVYNAAKIGLDVYNAEKENPLDAYLQGSTTLRSLARPMTDIPASLMTSIAASRYNMTPEQAAQLQTRLKDYGQMMSVLTGSSALPFVMAQETDAYLAGER